MTQTTHITLCPCPVCRGTGTVPGPSVIMVECESCGHTGKPKRAFIQSMLEPWDDPEPDGKPET